MNILLCDDDLDAIKKLRRLLVSFFEDKCISVSYRLFADGESALAEKTHCDLAFIDVEMPTMCGLSVARQLQQRNPNIIIFMVTSFQHYLDDSMELNVYRYHTKPIDPVRFRKNMASALRKHIRQNQTVLLDEEDEKQLIFTREILYICTYGRKTLIKTKSKEYTSRKTLRQWMALLNNDLFAQPHQGYIVNLQNVRKLSREEVSLCDGNGKLVAVIVSRGKYNKFKDSFFGYIGVT